MRWNWETLEVFKMLLTSFFPLTVLIIFVIAAVSAWGVYAFQIAPISAGGIPVLYM